MGQGTTNWWVASHFIEMSTVFQLLWLALIANNAKIIKFLITSRSKTVHRRCIQLSRMIIIENLLAYMYM